MKDTKNNRVMGYDCDDQTGMTLRLYIATQILAASFGASWLSLRERDDYNEFSIKALKWADALIKASNNQRGAL